MNASWAPTLVYEVDKAEVKSIIFTSALTIHEVVFLGRQIEFRLFARESLQKNYSKICWLNVVVHIFISVHYTRYLE